MFKSSKGYLSTAVMGGAVMFLSGCIGTTDPEIIDVTNGVPEINLELTGGLGDNPDWVCTSTTTFVQTSAIDGTPPEDFLTLVSGLTGGGFGDKRTDNLSLEFGTYDVNVDVACGCVDFFPGCLDMGPAWSPGLILFGGNPDAPLEFPQESPMGFDATMVLNLIPDPVVEPASASLSINRAGFNQKASFAAAPPSPTAGKLTVEVISVTPKVEGEVTECDLHYNKGNYGGFGFHGVSVTNHASIAVSGWEVYMDFGDAMPTPQWSQGGDFRTTGRGIIVSGDEVLQPGASHTFSVGGQYVGENVIDIACY